MAMFIQLFFWQNQINLVNEGTLIITRGMAVLFDGRKLLLGVLMAGCPMMWFWPASR
jgi:hypothetical protein